MYFAILNIFKIIKEIGFKATYKIARRKALYKISLKAPILVRKKVYLAGNKVNAAFIVSGGMGDILIFRNYLEYFIQRFSEVNFVVTVFFERGYQYRDLLFSDCSTEVVCYEVEYSFANQKRYDLFIDFMKFPKVVFYGLNENDEKYHTLTEFVHAYISYEENNPKLYGNTDDVRRNCNQRAKEEGRTRLSESDINGIFGIDHFLYRMKILEKYENSIITKTLAGRKFCTIHRGNDVLSSAKCVKLWDAASYNILIQMIKNEYPNLYIVQLGVSADRCPSFSHVDANFVGKTSMQDVCKLLSESCLHIDCEGGFVHLREMLHGGDTVCLFGPTDVAFYGYPDNHNINGIGCEYGYCESVTSDWMTDCAMGFSEPECMRSITPERVMNEIRIILG